MSEVGDSKLNKPVFSMQGRKTWKIDDLIFHQFFEFFWEKLEISQILT
jgi:hypothetical protein